MASSSKSTETQKAKGTAPAKKAPKPQAQAQAPAVAAPMVELALTDPANTPPAVLLQMQQQAGNQAMARLIEQKTQPQAPAAQPQPAPAAPRPGTRSVAPPGILSRPKLSAKPQPLSAGLGFAEIPGEGPAPFPLELPPWAEGLVPPAAPPAEPPPKRGRNKTRIKLTPARPEP